jgi:hypothetical protein
MTALLGWERLGLGSKVTDRHLERLAVVYVRQSTRQQVADHGESTRLQYALVERAVGLGWPASRVLVIDEDLGKSGPDHRVLVRPQRAGQTIAPGSLVDRGTGCVCACIRARRTGHITISWAAGCISPLLNRAFNRRPGHGLDRRGGRLLGP